MISGIYQIRNLVSGKAYIGSSIDIHKRFRQHTVDLRGDRHPNTYLQYAWDKYKERNFRFEVLLISEEFELLIYEQCLLDLWKPEYNLSVIAGRVEFTEEVRRKISEGNKGKPGVNSGRKFPASFGRKISKSKKGVPNPKVSVALKGRRLPLEVRRKISQSISAYEKTDEHKHNLSISLKGNKNGRANKGRTLSEETRRKMSDAHKRYYVKAKHKGVL